MFIYFVIGLVAVAIALEFLGPTILQKFFPQALVAPAPEVEGRPRRAAARDAIVDEAMEVDASTNSLATNAIIAAVPASAAFISSTNASADDALTLSGSDSEFDFDDYRTASRSTADRSTAAAMQVDESDFATSGAYAQQVEVIQGIPDVFEDEAAQHA